MTNPAPEPGQRVWIEAEVVRNVLGDLMFAPLTPDGSVSKSIRFAPTNYVWHPADVPPQPPVLAEETTVRIAGDDRQWRVYRWWCPVEGRTSPLIVGLTEIALTDAPKPCGCLAYDEMQNAHSDAAHTSCGRSMQGPEACGGCDDCVSAQVSYYRRLNESETASETATPTPDPPISALACENPEPVDASGVGEGAALIAATEQGNSAPGSVKTRLDLIAEGAAWEATARRLAALLDDQQPASPATPTPEPDEAQTGAEGAARCTCDPGPDGHPHRVWCATMGNGPLEPAAQGAGRDWRGELSKLIALEFAEAARLGLAKPGPNFMAERLVAALGLHDLEQAAARNDPGELAGLRGAINAEREHTRSAVEHVNQMRADVDRCRAELLQARASVIEWACEVAELRSALEAAGVPANGEPHEVIEPLRKLIAERDAARRELEQLRGEVGKIADKVRDTAELASDNIRPGLLHIEADLRAALAATAPATQDSEVQA